MATKPKDVIVLCLDVGPSMSFTPLDGGDTSLEKAIRIARQITQQKIFAGGNDLLGLVLFGTPDTDNELAADGGYENISVPYLPAQPHVDFLKYLSTEVKPGDVSADFIDAIVIAMDTLVTSAKNVKRVGDKKIYVMTDAGSEYSDNQLDQICGGLKAQNIELIVVGPSITPEDRQNGGDDGPPDDGPGPSHHPPSSSVVKKTAQQVAGEAVLSRLVEAVEGSCFSFNEALQISTFLRKNAKKQTARFAGCLEIGEKLKIPCKMYTKVMVERPASWKKLSAISQSQASNGSMAVKLHRTYHLNDEDETVVEIENVAKGYRYGKSLIPISEADETAMKFEAPRCLSLMGFSKMDTIKQHQFLGSSAVVLVANPDDKTAGKALSAIIHALYETNMAGLARYVWRKDSQPKVMALIPKIKAESEYLLVLQLPYMEDVRQFVFGPLPGERPNAAPSEAQLDAMDNLITNMDLMTADIEEGECCEALKPKKTCNPIIQRTFQCIAHRALNADDPLPEMEDSLQRLLQPLPSVMANCSQDLQRIKELFPLEKIIKKTKEEGAVAEAWKKTSDLDLDTAPPPAKRPHDDVAGSDEVDFSMASLAKGEVTKVGTLNPVSDYRALITKKNANFTEACKQLQGVAIALVKESFGDNLYDKAMECVQALRDEAIKRSEPQMFNDFLRELKDDMIGTRYVPFWDKVTGGGINLITSTECGCSVVSQEEADKFVEAGWASSAAPPAPAEEDMEDPDNLLELM